MDEFFFLLKRFRSEFLIRFLTGLAINFVTLFLFGMVLQNSVPDWMKPFSFLRELSTSLRALPPWDFILVGFTMTIIFGYLQRVITAILRRRNMTSLGKMAVKEHRESGDGIAVSQRRRTMVGRSRLSTIMFQFASSGGAMIGVMLALVLFGYQISAAILFFILVGICLYLPLAVARWLRGLEKNERDHEALRQELNDAGEDHEVAELHVITERMRIRANLPVLRFVVVWPMLAVVIPAMILAAAIESWVFAANNTDSSLNKLLIVLMALSLRTTFKLITTVESMSNRIARVKQPDPTEDDEES